MELRTLLTIIGALVASLGLAMLLPAFADAIAGNDDWRVFLGASLVTTLSGGGLWASTSGRIETLTMRQAFLLTALIWIVLTFFGALPFFWSDLGLSFTDSVFEAMSGITTTGATIMVGLDNVSEGILLWRGLLQWFGGLGIVVMAIAVLPMLQVGGMQMFKAEAFETPDKILPRATQIAGGMTIIYLGLTIACAAIYWFFGMNFFEAIVHAMTTVATGGFSTRDGSIESFNSIAIDYTSIVFMILGALPFALYLGAVQYGQWRRLFGDSQVRTFLLLLVSVTIIIMMVQINISIYQGEEAFRHALFSVTSVITGTGYATVDYGAWGPLATAIFFVLMFVGGCTGSTSCGIKIFRFQVLARDLYQHVRQILIPSRVYIKRYNGAPLPENVSTSVQSFVFLYISSFFVLAVLLSATGMDSVSALSGAATAISNVGPGLGDIIGPSGTFAPLKDISKWLLIIGMLVGRLEILIILVLFTPRFWQA
ncbi:Trk potassium uptake system protein TrkH [hydrothermal vent metagenome]|uniref:Trk potassium uptake system protein TrkH n=1 Tax=hydrothermal vent metagenome TaxID=652676 RepID=A0A3B0TZ04_9ZZZZ